MDTVRGYAGVTVLCGDRVLLVRAYDYFDPTRTLWSPPSGKIEAGEEPAAAAARELAEEAGCRLDPADLALVATVTVRQEGRDLSHSWNFTATVTDEALSPIDDPDEDVVEAAWWDRSVALDHLTALDHAPIREPALRFLETGERGLAWSFELVDEPAGKVPGFTWNTPSRSCLSRPAG